MELDQILLILANAGGVATLIFLLIINNRTDEM